MYKPNVGCKIKKKPGQIEIERSSTIQLNSEQAKMYLERLNQEIAKATAQQSQLEKHLQNLNQEKQAIEQFLSEI